MKRYKKPFFGLITRRPSVQIRLPQPVENTHFFRKVSVFSNFFALILSRNYSWLVVFSLFYCGDISAVRVKIRLRRPSVSRRCADEKAVKFPCRTPKYPADGNRGTCRGIFSRGNHQGLRGESLSACGKFPNSRDFCGDFLFYVAERSVNWDDAPWSVALEAPVFNGFGFPYLVLTAESPP